jgi:hypothetical protein
MPSTVLQNRRTPNRLYSSQTPAASATPPIMRQPFIRVLASALFLAAVTTGQDNSPPCIRSCYDNNPPPNKCGGVEEMTAEALATCTCSSFYTNQKHPLLLCIGNVPNPR